MVKKILFAFLILPMILSNVCYAKEEKRESPGSAIFVMAIPREVEITDEPIKIESEDMIVNMHLPHIKGLTDKKFERKINKHLKMRAMKLKNQAKANGRQEETATKTIRYEVISNYKIKESTNNYLTIGLFDYIYTGGSHGLPNQSYIVIDISENKILTLNQLFDDKVDYKENIRNLIQQQIEERTEKGQLFYDDLFHMLTVKEDERFYINPNGDLVIVFNVYEIAPYTSGIIEFTLPKEKLEGYYLNQ